MKTLLLQNWTEYEREEGWGATQRPDGISLHFDTDDYKEYVKRHWAKYPDSHVPDYYTAPNPYNDPKRVQVTDELFTEVMQSEYGKRFYEIPEGIVKD